MHTNMVGVDITDICVGSVHLVWLGSFMRANTSRTALQMFDTGPEIQHTRSLVPGYCSWPRENLTVVCVVSMSSAMVAPPLPMIIPGTTEGTKNLTNASSSSVGECDKEQRDRCEPMRRQNGEGEGEDRSKGGREGRERKRQTRIRSQGKGRKQNGEGGGEKGRGEEKADRN